MRTADFDQIVEQAFHRIPVRFRRRMHNVAVIVEDEPSPLQLQRGNASYASTLLGLYEDDRWRTAVFGRAFNFRTELRYFRVLTSVWRATARIWRVWSSKRYGTKSRITLG
jgi:hypothetical protein